MLTKYQKYEELIILYQTKGQHKMALDVLKNFSEIKESVLYGPSRTIRYLQDLGVENKAFIFEYSDWVLKADPEEGLKVFAEDIPKVASLPRAEVLDYFLKSHKNLVVPYLEFVIDVWKESKPLFHNILVQQYREQSLEAEGEAKDDVKKKLIEFLQSSSRYNPETVYKEFPETDLEERAIILGKWFKHRQTLEIYVQILGDFEQALKYCEQVYKSQEINQDDSSDDRSNKVYFTLIKIMLSNETQPSNENLKFCDQYLDKSMMVEAVLDILSQHGTKISPQDALEILPDDIPLNRIQVYLQTALRQQLEQKRKTQILKNLRKAEHRQTQELRIRHESISVAITEFSICPMCKKKFNNQSAFVRYPNGDIVHFSCQQRI